MSSNNQTSQYTNIDEVPLIQSLTINEKHRVIVDGSPLNLILRNVYMASGITHMVSDTYNFYSGKILMSDMDKLNLDQLNEQIYEQIGTKDDFTYKSFVITEEYNEKEYHSINPRIIANNTICFNNKKVSMEVDEFITKYKKRIHCDVLLSPVYYEYAEGKIYGFKLYLNQIKINIDNTACVL